MSKRNWTWLLLCVAFFTLALVGCSSKDRVAGSPGAATKDVTFNFNLQLEPGVRAKAEVPYSVANFTFIGYQDETKVYPADKDYLEVPKAEDQATQAVTVPEVPTSVNSFSIRYLAADGSLVAETEVQNVDLSGNEPVEIQIGDEENPIKGANLTVKFDTDSVEYPAETTHYDVQLYDSTPTLLDSTEPAAIAELKDVSFEDAPLNTAKALVGWYNGEELVGYTVADAPENMQPGQSYEIVIEGKYSPSAVTLNLTNCYKLQTAPSSDIKAVVTNNGQETEISLPYSAEGKYTLTVPVPLFGEVSITSIVLKDGDTPFEWLDYSTPITESTADLDVEENEFANGKFESGKTMEVANPRQLDNIRNHTEQNPEDPATVNIVGDYKQIKDIDFAGSCGSTLKAAEMGKGPAYAYDLDNANKNARFFGNEESKLFGWDPLGNVDVSFAGTYDGGGFKISNLVLDHRFDKSGGSRWQSCGLFGYAYGATLKNITIDKTCQFVAQKSVGSIAGELIATTMENCQASALVSGLEYYGGLVGSVSCNGGAISNCHAIGAQVIGLYNGGDDSEYSEGGFHKRNESSGGLCGQINAATVTNCSCDADTKISQIGDGETSIVAFYVGGITGFGDGSFTDCSNAATIFASEQVGGIIGYVNGGITMNNCHNSGAITRNDKSDLEGGSFKIGGLIGNTPSIPTFSASAPCSSTGTITVGKNSALSDDNTVAGIIGYAYSDLEPIEKADLQNAMKGCITQSVMPTGGFEHPHMYCGDPDIDEL